MMRHACSSSTRFTVQRFARLSSSHCEYDHSLLRMCGTGRSGLALLTCQPDGERWCAENRVQPGDGRVFGRNLKAAVPHLRDLRLNQAGERIWAYSGIGLRDDVVAYLGTQWS